jgi:hypothetical protein
MIASFIKACVDHCTIITRDPLGPDGLGGTGTVAVTAALSPQGVVGGVVGVQAGAKAVTPYIYVCPTMAVASAMATPAVVLKGVAGNVIAHGDTQR